MKMLDVALDKNIFRAALSKKLCFGRLQLKNQLGDALEKNMFPAALGKKLCLERLQLKKCWALR